LTFPITVYFVMTIHLAILAPTPALRSGLRALLAVDERIEVLTEAAMLNELDEMDGLDVLLIAGIENAIEPLHRSLQEIQSPPAILVLSDESNIARALASLPSRAWGLLPPDVGEEELLAAVVSVHEGLLTASPALMQPLLGLIAEITEVEEMAEELTDREAEVLQLLAQGMANKQIALRLNISEHTVKFHVSAIYSKLGVTNRTEAVRRGARLGLIVL
jgi:DNA-binding NarL/FixJ family response regulator